MRAHDLPPFWASESAAVYVGRAQDVLERLPAGSVQTVVTSPPYFDLRDYGHPDQLGVEPTVAEYLDALVGVLNQVWRVLRTDGTLWLNLGDTYANRADGSSKRHAGRGHRDGIVGSRVSSIDTARRKSLLMIPARVAIELTGAGWILRNDVIWHKPNAMPESVTDRFSTRHEHVFLFSKSERYYFDLDAVRVPQQSRGRRHEGRSNGSREGWPTAWSAQQRELHPLGKNPGDVWSMSTRRSAVEHFAMFPPDLPQRCVAAATRPGEVVLDLFAGTCTTGVVATRMRRRFVGIELVEAYARLGVSRLQEVSGGGGSGG